MKTIVFVLLFLVVLVSALSAQGATLYVDNSISPSSCTNYNTATRVCSGGSATAYKTIQAGISAMGAGYTLNIRGGTYRENGDGQYVIWIGTRSGLSSSNRLTIQNYPGEHVVIQPSSGLYYAISGDAPFVTLNGENGGTQYGIGVDGVNMSLGGDCSNTGNCGANAVAMFGDNWIVQGLELYNFPYTGVSAARGTSGAVIRRNKVHSSRNQPPSWQVGIYESGPGWTIEDNEIYGIQNNAALVLCPSAANSSQYCHNAIVRRNRIHDSYVGIFVYQGDNIQIDDNQIYRIAGLGIHATQYSAAGSYSNNTIYDVTEPDGNFWGWSSSGIYGAQFRSCIYVSGRDNIFRNNTTYNCDYPIYVNTSTAYGNTIENNSSVPPTSSASTTSTSTTSTSTTLTASQPISGTVTATWANIASPSPTDWLGLYRQGAPDLPYQTNLLAWMYVSCSKTPATGRASGSCPFVLPANLAAGVYELRLFANDDYIIKLATAAFTVSAPSIASPAPPGMLTIK